MSSSSLSWSLPTKRGGEEHAGDAIELRRVSCSIFDGVEAEAGVVGAVRDLFRAVERVVRGKLHIRLQGKSRCVCAWRGGGDTGTELVSIRELSSPTERRSGTASIGTDLTTAQIQVAKGDIRQ